MPRRRRAPCESRRRAGKGDARLYAARFERPADRADDQPAHQPAVAEAHFGFGGMHIHIHLFGGRGDEQHQHRMASARHEIAIGGAHGGEQQAVLHRAAVDEQILHLLGGTAQRRQAGESVDAQALALRVERHGVGGEFLAHHAGEAQAQAVSRRPPSRREIG